MTFGRPVSLPGVELAAGTYLFELASPLTDSAVVRVSSRDRRRIYYTGFTAMIKRPAGLSSGVAVILGEGSREMAPPIKAWFPDLSETGRQFIYRD
jgi:hypothetical protein